MGRGYSATRSHSGRKSVKGKRRRSLSISKLRDSLGDSSRSSSAASSKEGGDDQNAVTIKKMPKDIEDSDLEESEDEDERVGRQDVLTKYKMAGKLVDATLDEVCAAAKAGVTTKTLCDLGDSKLGQTAKNTMKHSKDEDGKKIVRGLSFPTTVCVNQILCNHAPFTDAEAKTLVDGDVVKVHCGCHLDGYPVSAARTIVVGAEVNGATNESAQRAIDAARVALTGAVHMMHPKAMNADITDFMHAVGHHYEVDAIEGVMSTRVKRWIPDSHTSAIINRRVTKEDPMQDVNDCEIGINEVWTLDCAYTNSANYKMQQATEPTNIFRRNEIPAQGDPRLAAANEAMHEVDTRMHCFAFSPSMSEQPLKFRLGLTAMKKNGLLDEYAPLQCKGAKNICARFSCTIAVAKKRTNIICGDFPLEEELLNLLPANIQGVLQQPFAHDGDDSKQEAKASKKRMRKQE